MQPAVRDELAAAGPVEPSSSPDLAPGPTFPAKSSVGYFRRRKTAELVSEVRRRYRSGENYSHIARAIAVTPDTARRWLDPEYDQSRRHRSAITRQPDGEGSVPTLPFVPGIVITGRYRMTPPL
jgi:hypothetical protein